MSFNLLSYYFQDQRERTYSTVKTKSTSASINNLKPGTVYVFQIRAFTAAGYGNYSPRLDVATLEEATGKQSGLQEINPFCRGSK